MRTQPFPLLDMVLLQYEERADLQEGEEGSLRRDVRDGMVELAPKVEDLVHLGDGLAELAELTGEALELGAVLYHSHLTLNVRGTRCRCTPAA